MKEFTDHLHVSDVTCSVLAWPGWRDIEKKILSV